MSRLDETFRPLAARLVARAGTAMTWRRAGVPAYDPASGEVGAAGVDIAVTGVVEEAEASHADGLVRRGDRIALLAAEPLDGTPVPGDVMLIDGDVHAIVAVATTWAGGRPALYRLHLRR